MIDFTCRGVEAAAAFFVVRRAVVASWFFVVLLMTTSMLGARDVRAQGSSRNNPAITRRVLASPEIIDGVRCGRTGRASAEIYVSGRVAECPMEVDTVIASHRIPAGSWLSFDASRAMTGAWFLRDVVLQGHECKGTGYKGWRVRFFPGGPLRSCFLAQDAVIDGIPCIRGTFFNDVVGGSATVAFHPNGRLATCKTSRAVTRSRMTIGKHEIVRLEEDGRIATSRQ